MVRFQQLHQQRPLHRQLQLVVLAASSARVARDVFHLQKSATIAVIVMMGPTKLDVVGGFIKVFSSRSGTIRSHFLSYLDQVLSISLVQQIISRLANKS